MSPKISDRPMASSTKRTPRTRPVKIWGRIAVSETSIWRLRVTLLGAGAVVLLVRRHLGHDFHESPIALGLAGAAPLDDPHVLHGFVVAGPPPFLALEVVVDRILPERVRHGFRVGRLGQLDATP